MVTGNNSIFMGGSNAGGSDPIRLLNMSQYLDSNSRNSSASLTGSPCSTACLKAWFKLDSVSSGHSSPCISATAITPSPLRSSTLMLLFRSNRDERELEKEVLCKESSPSA